MVGDAQILVVMFIFDYPETWNELIWKALQKKDENEWVEQCHRRLLHLLASCRIFLRNISLLCWTSIVSNLSLAMNNFHKFLVFHSFLHKNYQWCVGNWGNWHRIKVSLDDITELTLQKLWSPCSHDHLSTHLYYKQNISIHQRRQSIDGILLLSGKTLPWRRSTPRGCWVRLVMAGLLNIWCSYLYLGILSSGDPHGDCLFC